MDRQIIAVLFNEGGKLITELLRNRPFKRPETAKQQPTAVIEQPQELTETTTATEKAKASSVEAGCVPCAMGHFSTCSGLLNEAMRFAKKDGIESGEVIDRVGMCTDELNALERVDLRPELMTDLPEWEKELANKSLVLSRGMRHNLEGLTTVDSLEKVAANTQIARTEIGRKWFKERLARMPKEEKERLAEKAIEKLTTEEE